MKLKKNVKLSLSNIIGFTASTITLLSDSGYQQSYVVIANQLSNDVWMIFVPTVTTSLKIKPSGRYCVKTVPHGYYRQKQRINDPRSTRNASQLNPATHSPVGKLKSVTKTISYTNINSTRTQPNLT